MVNAYLLPLSALLLLGGAAGDRFGRRRLLLVGTGLFAAASVLCAAAPNLASLLAGRGLQGAGAALLMPSSLAILGATFEGAAKGRAIGIWAATGAIGGAIGPVLGGWLIDNVGWRAIFLINLPLAAGAIGLARACVPPDRTGGGQRLDWAGGALATASLGLLTWGLTVGSGPGGWGALPMAACAAGAMVGAAFVAVERRRGERAMMPVALFASRRFVGLSLLTLALYGALGALFVLLPYMLIEAGQYRGTAAGAALLPVPLILAAASPLAGGLAGRIGARLPLSVGPLVVAAGFLLALRIGAAPNYWTEVLPALVVMALGLSLAVAPLTTAVLSSVDAEHTGSASGFNSAVARTGGLIATALIGGVLAEHGTALIGPFQVALAAAAAAALVASACAWLLLPNQPESAFATGDIAPQPIQGAQS